jgi:hypothetical protein
LVLPNFLIIGAAKSGTSALYTYLRQHPAVFMPERKELRFFSYTGPAPDSVPKIYLHESITSMVEYQGHFSLVRNEKAIGESSPMYLYTPGTAERIQSALPDVQLIAILRNPVERAYSAYLHAVREWRESARDFSEALALEDERIRAGWGMLWHYKNAGFYSEQLARYYKVFKAEQLKVVLYDDLVSEPQRLIQDLFTFVGVDPDFEPDMTERPNATGVPKSQFMYRALRTLFIKQNPIKSISRLIFPRSVRKKFMQLVRSKNIRKQPMPQEIRANLMDYFHEDILRLQDLIGRDLNRWLGSQKRN